MKNEEIKKVEETVVEEVKGVAKAEETPAEPEKEKVTTKIAKGVKTHGKKIAKAALGIGIACFALGAKSAGKGESSSDYDDYSYGNDNESSSSDNELE